MKPALYAIIDDREAPPPEIERLIGDVYYGDVLRRRRRYVDEMIAAAAGADDVIVLRSEEDTERLVRRIQSARGDNLWLRLPLLAAPLNLSKLDFLIRKMRFALEPMILAPVFEDDVPMVLLSQDAIGLLLAKPGKERRAFILSIAPEAANVSHGVEFVDLRKPEALRLFLSGATEPRAFNDLSVDRGIFVKSSTDVEKMKAEHDFSNLAPPEMRRFLLPTFGYEERDGVASYRMEHLRIPDAALQFVLGTLSTEHFEQLLDQFFDFIRSRSREDVGRKAVRECGTVQILDKMDKRLRAFADTKEHANLDAMLQAGGFREGMQGLERRATTLIRTALDEHDSSYLAFSHGDPCLSNILFDRRIGLIRLIDPRGASTREDALMHPLYDIAKLAHSICGGYDFINNALFSVEVDADLRLELVQNRGGAPSWVAEIFRSRLSAEGWDFAQVRAVEASLFLSMLPLHREHPRKLLGFALTASKIIEELEGLS
ncbi:MAG: hypothetical protein AAGC81_13315 [Pseudomonadota bacterium]